MLTDVHTALHNLSVVLNLSEWQRTKKTTFAEVVTLSHATRTPGICVVNIKYEKLLTKKGLYAVEWSQIKQLSGDPAVSRCVFACIFVWLFYNVAPEKKNSLKDFRSIMNVVAGGHTRYTEKVTKITNEKKRKQIVWFLVDFTVNVSPSSNGWVCIINVWDKCQTDRKMGEVLYHFVYLSLY